MLLLLQVFIMKRRPFLKGIGHMIVLDNDVRNSKIALIMLGEIHYPFIKKKLGNLPRIHSVEQICYNM